MEPEPHRAGEGAGALGEPAAPLPAPYIDPWQLLRRDLAAVVADLRLKGRELWRRQREGDPPVPAFWPAGRARLFWPALLLALLLLITLAVVVLAGLSASRTPPSAPPRSTPPRSDATPSDAPSPGLPGLPPPPAALEEVPPAAVTPSREPLPAAPETVAPETVAPETAELEIAEPPGRDPWLEDLDGDSAHWIQSVRSEPSGASVRLVLRRGFLAQPPGERQQLAECWWSHARSLGYEHLSLEGAGGMPIGREARVGSGMILLSPLLPS